MDKFIKILRKLPDSSLEVEYDDQSNQIIMVIGAPPKRDAGDYSEDELLDYLAEHWPHPAFEANEAHADAAVTGLMSAKTNVTAKVTAADDRRQNTGQARGIGGSPDE